METVYERLTPEQQQKVRDAVARIAAEDRVDANLLAWLVGIPEDAWKRGDTDG